MNRRSTKKTISPKGQGALEYLLLIGGAVLIATVVLVIILATTGGTNQIINNNIAQYQSHISLGASGGGGGPPLNCGNGNIDAGEVCDVGPPLNLNGQTCALQGFPLGGTLSCNAGCGSFNTSACTPNPPSMATSFSMDFTTMNPVVFAAVSNNTLTDHVAFNNSSAGNLSITQFTPTFTAGTTLIDISLGGVSVWSGSASTGGAVDISATPITVPPGVSYATFTFSTAAHQSNLPNNFNISFVFSDTSVDANPTLYDVLAVAGPLSGSCTGATFNGDLTVPVVATGAMVTDKGPANQIDYGLVGDWSITPPAGATGVAFASLRVRVQSVAGLPSTTEYIIPGITSCVGAGLDDNTDDTVAPGTPINILPGDSALATHTFNLKSYVPSGGGTFQYIMTGQDVGLSNTDFRSYLTDQGANPPVLLVGFVV